ncbi:ABC transporter ATP-binding protein [Testudinibacter sp. TR-2022]|uniref:ABC transporter ATP-binding protein n=1 Tax=Testudinibacter sp. TR-2022 TaxID=2585029 RepID=UPI001118A780|nr:ABC transporter ATP-binding protein [Testudinibacter sp. TR-2022]TNH04171.1 ABC transporter ATP-binding protein [Pasteurellaceae bacterium Phil11]TNH24508.1 ABC transporter ATP-binding protein [Testudinibacter sp. TR-2022]TNH27934.1 ABC transporter ATP-binding protein [Testudinibacter sp. TR-2022]
MRKLFEWFEARIDPYPSSAPVTPKNSLFSFIWSGLDGLRWWLLSLIILCVGMGIFEAMLFKIMGLLVDWLATYSANTLWAEKRGSFMTIILFLISSAFWLWLLCSVRFQTLQGVFPMRLRWNFHRLMLGQSLSFYQDEFAGRVSAKVMQTALAVRDTVITCTDMVVYVAVYFISSGVILFQFDGWLLLPFLGWILLFSCVMIYFVPKLADTANKQADARSLMTGRITDAYANITTVKLFSHGERESNYAKSSMQEFMHTVHAQMRLVTKLEVCNHILNVSLVAATAGLCVYLWTLEQINVGVVAAATAMALRVSGLSHWIMWESARLFENIGTVQDGMGTLSKPHTVVDSKHAKPLEVRGGDIRFDHVNFNYDENRTLLKDFNLHIKPGEKVGLVGRSGAGKSTLTNLLLRFYDIDNGQILIDGQNVKDVTQESLRAQIGLVTQDTSLLHRSVRDNIIYGRPNVDESAVLKAAQQAAADQFIPHLHDSHGRTGYDAHVGERGVKLSGGQRQRIAIARVMLKDAPILLLDEATSALDSEVEIAIQENLEKLMENKTVIAIAHRLSTIAAMDRLIVMDQGQIIEQGTHQELLALNGVYAKLWSHQSGGFLAETTEI